MDWLYILEIAAFALVNLAFVWLADRLMEKTE
jgi:hypothetical protein